MTQNSSGDVIYVLIETADAEITAIVTRASVYVVKKNAHLCHSFILTDAQKQAGFIFKSTFAA